MAWVTYHREANSTVTGSDVSAALGFLLIMVYLFVGIAFASDIFMNAIEKICGSTKVITFSSVQGDVIVHYTKTIPVWNDTVANLSLMALGSSAPEILLSVIETVSGLGDQNPGELGPGTIVGSAAYNLMVITAVCITSVSDGRISRIKLYKVFGVTTVASMFAYIWMVVVLEWNTKDQVDLWEALATLLFFPTLVLLSFWADREFCVLGKNLKNVSTSSSVASDSDESGEDRTFFFGDASDHLYEPDGTLNKAALQVMYAKLTRVADLKPEEITQIIALKLIQAKDHSKAWHRTSMARTLQGGAKLLPVLNEKLREVVEAIAEFNPEAAALSLATLESQPTPEIRKTLRTSNVYGDVAVVEFQAATMAVSENIGNMSIMINRTGKQDVGFELHVESSDGTARNGKHYKPVQAVVKFDPYMKEGEVLVEIVDNANWNPDLNFFLKLSVPKEFEAKAVAGQTHIVEIIIQDDDQPGKISFAKRGYVFDPNARLVKVDVERYGGSDGTVTIQWKIVPGPDCQTVREHKGKLVFKNKELKKFIEIHVHRSRDPSTVDGDLEKFEVELMNPTGGAKLGKNPVTTVAVNGKAGYRLEINNVIQAAVKKSEEAEEEDSYKDQIMKSFKPNGGEEGATWKDYILHAITFPYKVTFSLIPPTYIWGGWGTFLAALSAVGLLTKVVGETASSFGIAIGLDPVITAITFVALGTSLPDTFASRISAQNDKTADNAVGNVTGSNSVNVFLGLGIPWTVGAFYYKYYPDAEGVKNPYCVPAGSLTFNVLVYTICASISIGILTFRRFSKLCGEAELGGPSKLKWATALPILALWFTYIFTSSLQVVLQNTGGPDISKPFEGEANDRCVQLIEESKRMRALRESEQ